LPHSDLNAARLPIPPRPLASERRRIDEAAGKGKALFSALSRFVRFSLWIRQAEPAMKS